MRTGEKGVESPLEMIFDIFHYFYKFQEIHYELKVIFFTGVIRNMEKNVGKNYFQSTEIAYFSNFLMEVGIRKKIKRTGLFFNINEENFC